MPESIDFYRRKADQAESKRMNANDRIAASLATDTSVEGFFLVDGSGEAIKEVSFPVRFINRPVFTTGGELHIDTTPVGGHFPTISCVINRFATELVEGYAKAYFVGAELLVVTTGPPAQRMWVHWRASGRAITNPNAHAAATTETPI